MLRGPVQGKGREATLDLLIVYSDTMKPEFLQVEAFLGSQGMGSHGYSLGAWPLGESEVLLDLLDAHSHWLFLVSPQEWSHPAFLFAGGYCLALRQRTFFWEPGSQVPPGWTGRTTSVRAIPSLLEALAVESKRWTQHLARMAAQEQLVAQGIDPTNLSFLDAVTKGDQGTCELFLQAGFSPDLADKKGVNLLCHAVRSAHLGVVRLLLDGGADVNLRSRDRDNSPVMDAAAEGHGDIVAELLARGAELSGISRNGQNALVLAIGKGAEDVAIQLLAVGGDPFVADKLGMNACQYARLLGRQAFLEEVTRRFPGQV